MNSIPRPSTAGTLLTIGEAANLVGFQRRRNLDDLQAAKRGARHHLARELHPRGLQSQGANGLGREGAQAAVKVADRNPEQQPAEETERRVAEISVHEWHRARIDSALESISHH